MAQIRLCLMQPLFRSRRGEIGSSGSECPLGARKLLQLMDQAGAISELCRLRYFKRNLAWPTGIKTVKRPGHAFHSSVLSVIPLDSVHCMAAMIFTA
jgi:hypothetical protein